MIDNPKHWLAGVPWDSVVTINKALCQAQKLEPGTKPGACERIREKWESAIGCRALFLDVLDLCRECKEAMPFTFNNGNTFASIAKTLIEDWLGVMPPVEAQIIRTTVAHYVAGLVSRKELLQVLRHFNKMPRPATATASPKTSTSTVTLQPQVQRAAS